MAQIPAVTTMCAGSFGLEAVLEVILTVEVQLAGN